MKHSTGTPTKAEKARFDKMKEMARCVACYQRGIRGMYIEIHHLLSGNKRIGHMATVSLCPWHHRGVPEYLIVHGEPIKIRTKDEVTAHLGPSLAHGSKPFRAEFGTDKELLDLQNALLEGKDGA